MSRIVRQSAGQNILQSGGKMQFGLDFLPDGYKVDAMHLCADITATAPAGGVTSEQQTLVVDRLESGRRLQSSGIGQSALDWQLNGKDLTAPAALAAGAGQAVKLYWPFSYRDERAVEPTDGAVATRYLKGQTLDVWIKDPNSIAAGFLITAGTVYLVVYLSPLSEGNIPQSLVHAYVEIIGKEVKLPAGALVDAVIVKNDGSAITDAELGTMKLSRDGKENLLEDATAQQLARSYNYFVAAGVAVQTQATGLEGEALPDTGSYPWVSLFHPIAPYKATKLPVADTGFTFLFTGTLTPNTARVYYRIIEPQTEEQTAKAAVKLGYSLADAVIEPKTVSKNGLPAKALGVAGGFKRTAGLIARKLRLRA